MLAFDLCGESEMIDELCREKNGEKAILGVL
jgi:hypothetical protein